MKNNKILLFSILFVVTVVISLGMVYLFANQGADVDFYIFENISECYKFNNDNKADITEYDTPGGDKHLEKIKYSEFYAAKYKSEELEFEIFAYEFETESDAKAYFKNATGKSSEKDANFSSSTGTFGSSEITVFKMKNAYTVYVSPEYLEAAKEFLMSSFSENVVEYLSKG